MLINLLFFKKKNIYTVIWLKVLLLTFNFLELVPWNRLNNIIYLYDSIFFKLVYYLNESKISFLVLVTIALYYAYVYKVKKYFLLFITMYFYINIYTFDYTNVYSYILKNRVYNLTLVNGLLLIHPILIYTSVSMIIFFNSIFHKNYNRMYIYIVINSFKKKIIFIALNALILGSWWSQQELNWGGWWNWDPIELISLLILLIVLIINHINFFDKFSVVIITTASTIIFIYSFFISRFDLVNSIHSFVSIDSGGYKELNIFYLFIFICVTVLFLKKLFDIYTNYNVINTVQIKLFLANILIYLSLVTVNIYKEIFSFDTTIMLLNIVYIYVNVKKIGLLDTYKLFIHILILSIIMIILYYAYIEIFIKFNNYSFYKNNLSILTNVMYSNGCVMFKNNFFNGDLYNYFGKHFYQLIYNYGVYNLNTILTNNPIIVIQSYLGYALIVTIYCYYINSIDRLKNDIV